MGIQIGWYNLREDTVFRNTFEFAAWYEDVLVKAGRYPVEIEQMRIDEDGRITGHCSGTYTAMNGVVDKDYFAAHYFGNPTGHYDVTKNAGKPARHIMFMYIFQVIDSILSGEGVFELLPEYEIRERKISYDGRERITHDLCKR